MSEGKHRVQGTLIFNDDESYEDYKSGNAKFNNGLRRENGSYYRQPDFEEENDDYETEEEFLENSEDNLSNKSLGEILINTGFIAAAFAAGVAVTKAAPKVISWWKTSASPIIKNKLNKIKGRKDAEVLEELTIKEVANVEEIELPFASLEQMDYVYDKYKCDITSEEAQRELLEIFILSALLVKKIKTLSESNIIDENLLIEKLTSKEYIDGVNQILIENPKLLLEKSDILSTIIGREIQTKSVYVPIERIGLKQQLTVFD